MSTLYSLVIPEGIGPGQFFQAHIGGELVKLKCPNDANSGSIVYVKSRRGSDELRQLHSQVVIQSNDLPKFPTTAFWIGLELISAIFYILAASLPVFAVQNINKNCDCRNPYTNEQISSMFYTLYHGLGQSKDCKSKSDDVCLEWKNRNVWVTFASPVNTDSSYGKEMQSDWLSAQSLIPIAGFLCLLAAYLHYYVESSNNTLSLQWKINITSIGANILGVAWILGLVCMDIIRYSYTVREKLWSTFYRGMYAILLCILTYLKVTSFRWI